jgi:23S rRNA (pseudouridine1915-N3)-methyltransferase
MELKFLKIEIVFPGKIKNDFILVGFQEYLKRLNRFAKISVVDFDQSHSKDPKICVEEESKKLVKYLCGRKFTLLDVDGIEINTHEFSSFIKREIEKSEIIFVVGGTYGVSEEVKQLANFRLSLSPMTFTHSMTLLLLVEQIYRAMKIISGQPYDH